MNNIRIIRVLDGTPLSDTVDDRVVAAILSAVGHPNYGGSAIMDPSSIAGITITQFPTILFVDIAENGNKTVVARLAGNVSEQVLVQTTQRVLNGEIIGSYYYDQDGNGTQFNGNETGSGFGLANWSGSKWLWLILAGYGVKKTIQADSSAELIISGSVAGVAGFQFFNS